MKKALLTVFLVTCLCGQAFAWTEYNSGPTGTSYYDESTITRAGKKVSAECRSEFKSGIKPRNSRIVFDCENATFSDEAYDVAPIRGEVLRAPGYAKLFKILCEEKTSKKAKKK